jgi:methyl-accepting chemotaxis protein
MIEMAAYGIADGDDRALQGLSMQTNTPLDGVSIALLKIRTRMQEVGMGLQNLEQVRKTAHELNEMTSRQNHLLAEESAALNKISETLAQFVADLEHIIPLQERSLNMSPMNNRQTGDWVQFLRQLVDIIREQQMQVNVQVTRLHKLEEQANLIAGGNRRILADLNTITQNGTNRLLSSGVHYNTERLTRKTASL